MKTTTSKLSLILTLGFIFSGCVVHRTVYVTAPPVEPVSIQTEVYEPQQTVYVEQPTEYYRAPDYVYSYYYCPEQNFYYNSESYSFWWYEGNGWRSGYELPSTYNIHSNTTYITVKERDVNPTKYNHNHVNYYKEGRYNNKIHRVGDDDNFRFERNAKTNNYYHKRDNNKQGGTIQKDVRPAGNGNQNNNRGNGKGQGQRSINTNNNNNTNNARYIPNTDTKPAQGIPQGQRLDKPNQGKDNELKPAVQSQPPAYNNTPVNNGRNNEGSPNREVKQNQGNTPSSGENAPNQGYEKQQKKVSESQNPNQGLTKSNSNKGGYNQENYTNEPKPVKSKESKVRESAPNQGNGNQGAPEVREKTTNNGLHLPMITTKQLKAVAVENR